MNECKLLGLDVRQVDAAETDNQVRLHFHIYQCISYERFENGRKVIHTHSTTHCLGDQVHTKFRMGRMEYLLSHN